ncbi:MAG: DUF2029 domain-containing protein [Verrucomicrobia bacterium]|nr:DUF2029 domain-containing protein [Verrucomicrobiota bacterium]
MPPDSRQSSKASLLLWLYVTIAGSMLLRLSIFDFESGDYHLFLSNWYDFFVQHGRWQGLGELTEEVANYPPLYMYFVSLSTLLPLPKLYAIKLFSVAADYLAAWYVWWLVRREFPAGRRAWATVTAFLFLPTVVMNSALWGQCDMMYTGGLLASLFYLMEKRPVAALVAFGFSCSLKPQAIFWCPLLAGLLVAGRLPWKKIWIPATVYAAWGIPEILAGRPVLHVLGHWGRVKNLSGLTLGATNWYQWVFEQQPEIFWLAGIVLTVTATAFFVLWVCEGPAAGLGEAQWLVSLAMLSLLFPPFLLPGMHERYFFAADVLSVVYAFYVSRGFWVMLLIQFASAFTYLPYLFRQEPVPRWLLPFPILAAIGLVIKSLVEPVSNRPESENPI